MKTKKVISPTDLPSRIPLNSTILWWLFLDRLQAPAWVFGAVFAVIGILWIVAFLAIWREEHVELFHDNLEQE